MSSAKIHRMRSFYETLVIWALVVPFVPSFKCHLINTVPFFAGVYAGGQLPDMDGIAWEHRGNIYTTRGYRMSFQFPVVYGLFLVVFTLKFGGSPLWAFVLLVVPLLFSLGFCTAVRSAIGLPVGGRSTKGSSRGLNHRASYAHRVPGAVMYILIVCVLPGFAMSYLIDPGLRPELQGTGYQVTALLGAGLLTGWIHHLALDRFATRMPSLRSRLRGFFLYGVWAATAASAAYAPLVTDRVIPWIAGHYSRLLG